MVRVGFGSESSMFSQTVSESNTLGIWNFRPTPCWAIWVSDHAVVSWPSKKNLPECTWRSPEIVFSVVVLPAPLAPISVVIVPSSTENEMPRIASMWP